MASTGLNTGDHEADQRALELLQLLEAIAGGRYGLPLDAEVLELLATRDGQGWPRYITDLLGVPWPLRRGWQRDLWGQVIPWEAVERIVAYKELSREGRRRHVRRELRQGKRTKTARRGDKLRTGP